MSKRIGFQFRQPRAKMPKLDITISSSQRIPIAGPSTSQQSRDPGMVEEAWCEDEEDEIFVLASQAVEQVQANAAVVISQAMNSQAIHSTTHDISYNRFRQNVRAIHSTQINDSPMDIFDNDEEDIFSNVPDFVSNNVQPSTDNKENHGQAAQQNNVNNHHHHNQQQQQQQQHQSHASENTAARNQMEKIQTEFYGEKIKVQKKEIEQLKETLNKLNQRCTTKEGEASTLRYEVHSKSTEIDRLRREKMQEAVEIERKFAEKIAALEKKIETQRSELEFKNIEILNKKPRKSLNDSTIQDQAGSSSSLDNELNYTFKLPVSLISSNDPIYTTAAEFLTQKGFEKYRGLSERDFDTLNSLSVLQSLYNGAKAKQISLLDDTMLKEFKRISNALIEALKIYASRLTQRTPTKYNPVNEYKTLSEETLKLTAKMAKEAPASTSASIDCDEKLIYETQVLAVIALICTEFENATQTLLFEKCESCATDNDENEQGENRVGSFVDILTDVLCAIGHSTTLSSYKSLIESVSLTLVALAKSYNPTDASDLLLLNLFQAIVYCEPVLNSLNHLSEFLSIISENQASNICNRFCLNEANNVMSFQRYKIHRFSIDTCPLQVLSCLLQTAFQPYGTGKTPAEQSDEVATVANITIRMLKFFRNCFKRRVDWLFRRNRNGNDTPQISYCYCYIVSCIVALLHFCINSWMENHKNIDMKLIKTISFMGSLFLFDIIKKHFEPKVLSLGGFPVKNRLQAIHDWIMSYSFFVRVSSISENAMKSVNLRRIAQLNEPQMVSTTESQHHKQDDVDKILQDSFEDFLI